MQKDTIVETSSILQRQKIPEGIRMRLKNHFPSTGNSKNHLSQPKTFQKTNKTGTSKVGARSKAQEAQSFLNMLRTYS